MSGYIHIIDKNQNIVIASTDPRMIDMSIEEELTSSKGEYSDLTDYHYTYHGKKYCVYQKDYGNYVLIRSYLSFYLFKEMIISSVLVFLYIGCVAVIVISLIAWYVKKRIANNLTLIVDDLKKIENGNLENIELKTGISEFDELTFYVNQLLKSVRLNWNKLSNVIDKGQLPIGIFENNTFYKKKVVNERLLEIFDINECINLSEEEVIGRVQGCIDKAFERIVDQDERIYEYIKDDMVIYLRIEVIEDEQSITYYISDVSLWWDELNLLRVQSNNDVLTGLYNRRGFSERLNELFQKPQQLGYSVMLMIDADGLKKINDLYGHHLGDEYLRSIADSILISVKGQSVCARLGGDEFAVFVYGCMSLKDAENIVEDLKEVRGKEFISEHSYLSERLEFSIGEAYYPMDGNDYHLLMHIADQRMYEDKRGRKKIDKA